MSQLWIIGDNASTEKPSPHELVAEIQRLGAAPRVVSAPSYPLEIEVAVFPNVQNQTVIHRLESIVKRLPIGYLTLLLKESQERRRQQR